MNVNGDTACCVSRNLAVALRALSCEAYAPVPITLFMGWMGGHRQVQLDSPEASSKAIAEKDDAKGNDIYGALFATSRTRSTISGLSASLRATFQF